MNEYSLTNPENYKKELNTSSKEVINKYKSIIIEYLKEINKYFLEKKPNLNLYKFLLIRGLDTINHIFTHILIYTKNLSIAHIHSQKAVYYYLEFINQIYQDKNIFLQLTSREAVIYVYKKTIYDIVVKNKYTDSVNFLKILNILKKNIQECANIISENSGNHLSQIEEYFHTNAFKIVL